MVTAGVQTKYSSCDLIPLSAAASMVSSVLLIFKPTCLFCHRDFVLPQGLIKSSNLSYAAS